MKLQCSECGRRHDLDALSLAASEPAQWMLLSEAERTVSALTRDQCVIHTDSETAYFVAGVLNVPILTTHSEYTWAVWVSLSKPSFDEVHEHWNSPDRHRLGPYFGWLCTGLPGYPDTMFLKAKVHQREIGLRPAVVLEPATHPLADHQRNGMRPAEIAALLHSILRPDELV